MASKTIKQSEAAQGKNNPEQVQAWVDDAEKRHAETFATPDEARALFLDYLAAQVQKDMLGTISGVALHMGFCSESGLHHLGERGPEWAKLYKEITSTIISAIAERLINCKSNAVGPIFYLKNRAGYRDKQPDEVAAEVDDWVSRLQAFSSAAGRMDDKTDQAVAAQPLTDEADLLRFALPDAISDADGDKSAANG